MKHCKAHNAGSQRTTRYTALAARAAGWLLSLLLLCAPAALSAPAETQATAQQLRQTLEQLNALDKWFSDADKRRAQLLQEIQQQDQGIARLNRAVDTVQGEVEETGEKLRSLEAHRGELEEQRAVQARLIGEHVASAYRLTGQDFLKQLLNQESPDEFERMIRYHRYFSESRLAMLDDYQATLTELADTNEQLSAQQRKQTAEQEKLQQEQQALTGQREERGQLISKLDSEKESKTEEYQRLEADRDRLETLLAELRRRANQLDAIVQRSTIILKLSRP